MKQKIVIKVSMADQKSRTKALRTAAGHAGVVSAALTGQDKNQIEVVGDGIDAVKLTYLLRKKLGYADLVTVKPVEEKKEDKKKDKKSTGNKPDVTQEPPIGTYYPYSRYQLYEIRDPFPDPSCCTIM